MQKNKKTYIDFILSLKKKKKFWILINKKKVEYFVLHKTTKKSVGYKKNIKKS